MQEWACISKTEVSRHICLINSSSRVRSSVATFTKITRTLRLPVSNLIGRWKTEETFHRNYSKLITFGTGCYLYQKGHQFMLKIWDNYFRALVTWYIAVHATKRFTLKRFQFLGMMAKEYLVQITPVMPKAQDWLMETLLAGLCRSPRPAITSPYKL